MREHAIGSLLVVSGNQMVGIVSEGDLMRAVADGHDPSDVPVPLYMTVIVKLWRTIVAAASAGQV